MEETENKWQEFKKRLKNHYRLVVLNDDTLQEVRSFNLSLQSLYIGLCSFLILGAILIYLLIAYTPLKRMIPGYGELESNREVVALLKQVSYLEEEVSSQQTYIQNFQHYVTGVVPEHKDSIDISAEILPEEPVERIEEDEILRNEIEQETNLRSLGNIDNPSEQLSLRHLVPPVKGTISTKFDPGINHLGVDVLAPKNTSILAITDGVVVAADWTLQTGNTITLQHENNVISSYKHNSSLLKKTGDHVKAGDVIAIIGNSGTLSSGPHLHFELWQRGIALNPEHYIIFE